MLTRRRWGLLLLLWLVTRRHLMMGTTMRTAVMTAESGGIGCLRVDGFGVEQRRGTPIRVDGGLDRVGVDERRMRHEFRRQNPAVAQRREMAVVVMEMTIVEAPIVVGISTAAAGWSWIVF